MTTQEAIKILDQIPTKGDEVDAMEMAIEALSAERKGEWIPDKDVDNNHLWHCSICGFIIYSESEYDRKEYHKFCGRCGTDMRGGKK